MGEFQNLLSEQKGYQKPNRKVIINGMQLSIIIKFTENVEQIEVAMLLLYMSRRLLYAIN